MADTQPDQPPAPSSWNELLTEKMREELARETELLDEKGWIFHLVGSSAVALQIAAMCSRTLADPHARPDEKVVATDLAAVVHKWFAGHSSYIEFLLERAFPEILASNGGGNNHAPIA